MSTSTETEFTGEENSSGTTVEKTDEHPLYEHRETDGSVHYGYTPMCSGGCIKKTEHPPYEHRHEDGSVHYGFAPACSGGCIKKEDG